MMHAASLAESPRLRTVVELLLRVGPRGATTREIIEAAEVCAVNSVVSEIRKNGIGVECRYERTTKTRQRVYRYILISPDDAREVLAEAEAP